MEGWLTITAWAMATKRVTVGLMVGANTFREPPIVAKMATTLDHISGGRAVLGIGAAWFETEHKAFGLPVRRAARRSGCAGSARRCRSCAACSPGSEPSAAGGRYHAKKVRNLPPPMQRRLPLLVGGGGEKVTLKLVAQYADANNVGGGFENVKRKDAILRQHCETRRPGRARDRADGRHRVGDHPRLAGRGEARPEGDLRAQRQGGPLGRTSRSGRRRTSSRCSPRTPRSATTTSSPASRRRTTRSR